MGMSASATLKPQKQRDHGGANGVWAGGASATMSGIFGRRRAQCEAGKALLKTMKEDEYRERDNYAPGAQEGNHSHEDECRQNAEQKTRCTARTAHPRNRAPRSHVRLQYPPREEHLGRGRSGGAESRMGSCCYTALFTDVPLEWPTASAISYIERADKRGQNPPSRHHIGLQHGILVVRNRHPSDHLRTSQDTPTDSGDVPTTRLLQGTSARDLGDRDITEQEPRRVEGTAGLRCESWNRAVETAANEHRCPASGSKRIGRDGGGNPKECVAVFPMPGCRQRVISISSNLSAPPPAPKEISTLPF
ncbi:hypothetical protein DFH07DRAFT_766452 [Mycena maculata]|uniref:Uncharacterized protein n=1 Tax=Mycena maculata TaxID=230809 RepID=A0AAD7K8A3_9AGAR|nr:hypothetical protein DFH07DRAFT_766452 [Mycena maculata]